MGKIVYRGKDVLLRSVGPSKSFEHQTIQAAIDYIDAQGDAAADNPYMISVAPGVYNEAVTIPDGPNLSYCSLVGESAMGSVLGGDGDAVGGSDETPLVLAPASGVLTGFSIERMHIVRVNGAIGSWVLDLLEPVATATTMQDISVLDCIIEAGDARAVRVNGLDGTSAPGRVLMMRNRVLGFSESNGFADSVFRFSPSHRLTMMGNYIKRCVTKETAWLAMHTGSMGTAGNPHLFAYQGSTPHAESRFLSSGDVFDAEIAGVAGTSANRSSGVIMFRNAGSMCPSVFLSPYLRYHRSDQSDTGNYNANRNAAIAGKDNVSCSENEFLIQGGAIVIDIDSTGDAPAQMSYVDMNSSAQFLKIDGTVCAYNDPGGLVTTKQSLDAGSAGTIEGRIITDNHAVAGAVTPVASTTKP